LRNVVATKKLQLMKTARRSCNHVSHRHIQWRRRRWGFAWVFNYDSYCCRV